MHAMAMHCITAAIRLFHKILNDAHHHGGLFNATLIAYKLLKNESIRYNGLNFHGK